MPTRKSWEDWIAAYRYRLEKGSYRAELAPARPRDQGGMTLHEALRFVEADSGEAGLRAFYDEICAATPEARARLHRAGMLRRCELDLDRKKSGDNFLTLPELSPVQQQKNRWAGRFPRLFDPDLLFCYAPQQPPCAPWRPHANLSGSDGRAGRDVSANRGYT
ncbi:hypothetical protein ACFOHS_05975 [Jhaorihella thermophila]